MVKFVGQNTTNSDKLSQIKHEEIADFFAEVIDRFGSPIPEEFENLIDVSLLQKIASKMRITNINIKNSFFTISFDAAKQKNFNKLFIHITQNPLNFKLIDQNKIKIKSKYNCCKDVLKSSVKDLITDHTITL